MPPVPTGLVGICGYGRQVYICIHSSYLSLLSVHQLGLTTQYSQGFFHSHGGVISRNLRVWYTCVHLYSSYLSLLSVHQLGLTTQYNQGFFQSHGGVISRNLRVRYTCVHLYSSYLSLLSVHLYSSYLPLIVKLTCVQFSRAGVQFIMECLVRPRMEGYGKNLKVKEGRGYVHGTVILTQ